MHECIIEKNAIAENIEEMSNLSEAALRKFNMPEDRLQELLMALDEVITNIVIHGYSGRGGALKIIIQGEKDHVSVELVDNGIKFDPTKSPEPDLDVPIEERKIGGMGVPLVRKFTDELRYRHVDGENHFVLIKKTGGKDG